MNKFFRIKNKLDPATLTTVLFFFLLLIVGLSIYRDYGISWDEPIQRKLGLLAYHYIKEGDPTLLHINERWYGTSYELFLLFAQNNNGDQAIYFSRHLLTFLTFYAGIIGFYFLAKRFLSHKWLALLGSAALVLSPRIFADSFYNSKDIPFLVTYSFALLSMLWYVDRPNLRRGLVHALFTAGCISIRLPGLVVPVLTAIGLFVELIQQRISFKRAIGSFSIFIIGTIAVYMALCQSLWADPLTGFNDALHYMSHFPSNLEMLFMGKIITASNLPWYYVPVWLVVTTPLLYTLAFLPGAVAILARQKGWLQRDINIEQRDELLALLAFLAPLLAVILLHSVLYDGWRQMFFIYPPFLLVALKGMQSAWEFLKHKFTFQIALTIGIVFLLTGMLPVAMRMFRDHPYQNVYFNRLAGEDMQTIQQRFMLDYWGLSYRAGLEYLAATDSRQQIPVYLETSAGINSIPILPKEDAIRIHVVPDLQQADYYVGNYYLQDLPYPLSNELFSVQVGNANILSVFRLTEEEKY